MPLPSTRQLLGALDRFGAQDEWRDLRARDELAGIDDLAIVERVHAHALNAIHLRQRIDLDLEDAAARRRDGPVPAGKRADGGSFASGRARHLPAGVLLQELAAIALDDVQLGPLERAQRGEIGPAENLPLLERGASGGVADVLAQHHPLETNRVERVSSDAVRSHADTRFGARCTRARASARGC